MNCYVVNYSTATSRRKTMLVLADNMEHARRLAENYLDDKKISSITYVIPRNSEKIPDSEKNS